jgi:hypothetical protein
MNRSRRTFQLLCAGSTLIEAMVACGIVALFFAGLFDMNWRGLYMLKTAADTASASTVLANLAEQVRTANYTQVTDPTYLSGTILTSSSATLTGHLPNVTEQIDVYALSGSTGASIEARRDGSGNVTTPLTGNGQLSSLSAVRVDITLTWSTALRTTSHTRMLSLIVGQAGVLGLN